MNLKMDCNYEELCNAFVLTIITDKEMKTVVRKFHSFKDENPFYIDFKGMAPTVNPRYPVILIKHKDGLRNTSAGLEEYLQAILNACGILRRVGLAHL